MQNKAFVMRLLFVLAVCGMLPLSAYSQSDTLEIVLSNYFKHYKAPNFNPTGVCKLTDCTVNEENKTTVILTTHDLKDIEDVCDRIILLDKGQIIYDGEKQKFKDKYGKYITAELIVKNKKSIIKNDLKNENLKIIEEKENSIKLKFFHEKITILTVMDEISKYCEIEDVHMKEAELEDILKEIYKGAHKC